MPKSSPNIIAQSAMPFPPVQQAGEGRERETQTGVAGSGAPCIFREWAMPSSNTFSIGPVREFVAAWLTSPSIDPFARNSRLATVSNDLNPTTTADYHLDAEAFCRLMAAKGRRFECGLFDPPYSPRQISECYQAIGKLVTAKDTQNAALYARVRDALDEIIDPGGIVLSFGWNSAGMGKTRGYAIEEILIVCHGGAHNDTICVAERKGPVSP